MFNISKNLIALCVSLFASVVVFAQAPSEPVTSKQASVEVLPFTDRDLRSHGPWNLSGQFVALSLPMPLKMGASGSWNYNPTWTFEASMLSGGISAGVAGFDLGGYSEKSYQLLARYFGSNQTFNWVFGLSQETGRARIGNKYLSYATGVGQIDVAQMQSWAVVLGFGQRWQWDNGLSVGLEWAQVSIPVSIDKSSSDFFNSTANESDKKKVQDILDFLVRFPRISLLQVSVGYSF